MPEELPAGITDARAAFRALYCAVVADHGASLPDNRPCDAVFAGPSPSDLLALPELVPSRRNLVALFVPGIGYECVRPWMEQPKTAQENLRRFGYDGVNVAVEALSSSARNAAIIRDAVLAEPVAPGGPRIVLVGYSKGMPDVLEAIVRYPEILNRVVAVVSVAGAVQGSPLAESATQGQADLFRHFPKSDCGPGDGGAVESLRPDVRKTWLAEHPLPASIRYYSLVTLPRRESISNVLSHSWRKLAKIDPRNDSQMLYVDQFIPGSTLLAMLDADHWAAALPIARAHRVVGTLFVDKNAFPREALLEAVMRFIEGDLDRTRNPSARSTTPD
jgi:hypothetical protein